MSIDLKECEIEALRLPLKERAELAEHLITSLDKTGDVECERLWLEEAERRYQEYKKGNILSRPAKDIFRDAYTRIK